MFRTFLVVGAAAVGAALGLAPNASASPDDRFLSEVQYAVHIPVSRIAWQLVNAAHGACSILAQGYNSSEAMDATTHGFHGLVDPIGFMLASTRAYCPQYAHMYAGL